MSVSLSAWGIRVLVLDIEGTTTPIEFVYHVLFPFARAEAEAYLEAHWAEEACRAAVELLRAEHAADVARGEAPPSLAARGASPAGPIDVAPGSSPAGSIAAYVHWLMDRDRKSTGLKLLQGHIWQKGYRAGRLHGEIFADVAPALERWRASGLRVCIYSSGSVLAQQLLFGSTRQGDLTGLLSGYFDTTVGPKTSPESYRRIAERVGVGAGELLFISDAIGELDAARMAGCRTALCVRPTNPPAVKATAIPRLPRSTRSRAERSG